MPADIHEWTTRDKRRYALALAPFVMAVAITTAALLSHSGWHLAAWCGLYLSINVFQAGCCVGCPYRGRYCPAILGIYLSNWLSDLIYPDRAFDRTFFHRNAVAAEVSLFVFTIFPLYWLWAKSWILVPIYLVLLAGHFMLFMPSQCEHCSYNETCPGGQTWKNCKRFFRLG